MGVLPFPFRVGDKVVYPNHGVGIIEQISSRAMGNNAQQFYMLKIQASNLRVMVPFSNVGSVGMRPIAHMDDVNRTLDFLEGGACIPHTDWKGRFKENSEKMRTGSMLQVAEVLKSLLLVNQEKPLSFREKKMLDRALALLVSEIGTAKKLDGAVALELLQNTLTKAQLALPPLDPSDA
ncbi:MAG: CarD family transcriptional regulator [Terriglobales bacterium]